MDAVAELARKAGCKLTVCPQKENRNDRWIQVPRPPGSTDRAASQRGRLASPSWGVGRRRL